MVRMQPMFVAIGYGRRQSRRISIIVPAGPLFCGGITVFNPIIQHDISPLARVGVIGIGGLGHLALQFLRHWGCEVYAFTSTDSKREEAVRLGAHQVINSRHDDELSKIRGALDMILVTVSVPLNWAAYFDCLAPKGVLHFVGVVPEPVSVMPSGPKMCSRK